MTHQMGELDGAVTNGSGPGDHGDGISSEDGQLVTSADDPRAPRAVPGWMAGHQHTPVWMLTITVAVVSVLLWTLFAFDLRAPNAELSIPWWIIVFGFFAVEAFVVNLHFRSESGSFSMLEIPLVFGLMFTEPGELWIAMIIGGTCGFGLARRQRFRRLAFNVANLSMHGAVAVLLFHAFLGDADTLSLRGWLALFGATAISGLLEISLINMVISITERRFVPARALNITAFGSLVSLANTVQALIAALIVVAEPWGGILLIGSTGVLFAAYRAYVSERDHREQVEFLYNSTRALRESSESTAAISTLLEEATSMFRAGTAELVLFSVPDSGEPAARFIRSEGASGSHAISADEERLIMRVASHARDVQLCIDEEAPEVLQDYLHENGVRDAMVGTLSSEQRVVGLFFVGDRLGNVTTFNHEDLRLFENLIDQAAVALENDQLEHTLAKLRELEMELAYQARYDTLTGLANRSLFTSRVDEHMNFKRDSDAHILYIDLDDFKLVNDTLGHASGDVLLAEVANRIRDAVRPGDLAARLGGDEFAIMLVSSSDSDRVAHRIIDSLMAPFLIGTNEVRIGASIGIAVRSSDETALDLLHKADLAMYSAKERGRGSVASFTDSLEHDVARQQTLQTDLRRAISEEEFDVLYQPIVRLEDLAIVGAEALVRWRQKSGSLLAPGEFITEAERSGLITSIDALVRKTVLSEVNQLVEAAPGDFFASINLSARHLHQTEIVGELARDLLAAGAAPESIVLEVTETAFARDHELAAEVLRDIRSLGVRIALDDFGTGYSSLSYLRDLPIDLLKIAQPFINDLVEIADPTFVEAITKLSHTLGLQVVAEGIETVPALTELQAMNCDLGQGYHFSRPMTMQELTKLLADQRPDLDLVDAPVEATIHSLGDKFG